MLSQYIAFVDITIESVHTHVDTVGVDTLSLDTRKHIQPGMSGDTMLGTDNFNFTEFKVLVGTAVSVLQFRSVNFVNMAHSTERA